MKADALFESLHELDRLSPEMRLLRIKIRIYEEIFDELALALGDHPTAEAIRKMRRTMNKLTWQ